MRKLNKCFNEKLNFIMIHKTNKLAVFCNTKDPIKLENKVNVIYRITCPGYFNKYLEKTDRNLITTLDDHDTKSELPM